MNPSHNITLPDVLGWAGAIAVVFALGFLGPVGDYFFPGDPEPEQAELCFWAAGTRTCLPVEREEPICFTLRGQPEQCLPLTGGSANAK